MRTAERWTAMFSEESNGMIEKSDVLFLGGLFELAQSEAFSEGKKEGIELAVEAISKIETKLDCNQESYIRKDCIWKVEEDLLKTLLPLTKIQSAE